MQTIRLSLSHSLKNAVQLPANETGRMLIAEQLNEHEKKSKLTTTKSEEDDTTRLLVNQEVAKLCSKIEQQIKGQATKYTETVSQFQELAVRLAMEIATAVVRYEVSEHETRIRRLLEDLITRHEPPIPIVAYVNKLDLERLRISFRDNPSLDSLLQLKSDESVAQGDVRVESSEQRVIASCQQQLASIQLQLMEYLSDARLRSANR